MANTKDSTLSQSLFQQLQRDCRTFNKKQLSMEITLELRMT